MDYFQNYDVVANKRSWAAQMAKVYGWMFIGLIISAASAIYTLGSSFGALVFNPVSMIVLFVAEIGLVWFLSRRALRMSYGAAAATFVAYSALNGITLSVIFMIYTLSSIAYVFLITAAIFAFMSVYGLVTKTDLSSYGNLLFMGLIGIIIASLVNIFLNSTSLYWIISYIGVAVFIGLTAYDSQKIRNIHASYAGTDKERNVAIVGALTLYLDFINLFLFILRILGRRR